MKRPIGTRILRALAPSAVSLGVHLALLAALASVTLSLSIAPSRDRSTTTLLEPFERTEPVASEPTQQAAPTTPYRTARPIDAPAPPIAVQRPPEAPTAFVPAATRLAPPPAQRTTTAALERVVRERPRTIDFAGVATRSARSVVFVVDASGAMTTSMPFVLAELERSLADLGPNQRFQVVAFRDLSAIDETQQQPAIAFGRGQLLEPTPAVRAAVASWLDSLRLGGRSTPLPGLELALSMQPDAIFLLSRSIRRTQEGTWDLGPEAVLDRLARINPTDRSGRRRTRIHAIQFIDPDPTGLMPRLAEIHGGRGAFALRSLDELATLSKRPPAVEADAAIDRAIASLAQLAATGSDLFVLYGMPTPEQRRRASQSAAAALSNLPASGDRAAIVRVLRARALRLMGQPAELETPPGDWPDATTRTLASLALGSAPSFVPRSVDPLVRAEAAIARVRFARVGIVGRVAEADALLADVGLADDPVWQLVLRDAAALAHHAAGEPVRSQRELEAILSIEALGDEQQRIAILEHRLDLLLSATNQSPATDPARLVAAERAIARNDRTEAIALLRTVSDARLVQRARERLIALLSVGSPRDMLEAASLLLDQAESDAEQAAALAHQAIKSIPRDASDRSPSLARYAAVLDAVLSRDPEHAAFWRAERSRVAIEQAASLPPERAIDVLATIERGTADPQTVLEAIARASTTGRAKDRAIALLDRWDTGTAIRARRSRAAELAANDPTAAERIYRDLLALPAEYLPDRPVIVLDLAALLRAQGRPSEAFGLAMPVAHARIDPGEPIGWRAWTVALESLAEGNADGDTKATARAHLLRLRSLDPELGGKPWSERLSTVERVLSP